MLVSNASIGHSAEMCYTKVFFYFFSG